MIFDFAPERMEVYGPETNQQVESAGDSEASLICAAKQGNLSAFNQLVLIHQDDLYRWAYSLVRDEALAEDITQATFIKAYEKLQDFRGSSLRAWLFRIVRNHSYDEFRSQKRFPAIRLDDGFQDEEASDMITNLSSADPSPEEALIQKERMSWVQDLLASLPEPYRKALELVDLYEMDYQEAAVVLGVPPGTIKSRVSRARIRLRESIAQQNGL